LVVQVDKEVFYQKLAAALLHAGFRLEAGDASQDGVSRDRDQTLSTIRNAAEMVLPLHPVFDREVIRKHLDKMRDWAAMARFKYVLGQPVVVAVVEADRLADDELVKLAKRFDQDIVEMLDVTSIMGSSIPIGRFRLGGVRLSSTGIILFVFFDHASASLFAERVKKRCKIEHFWKKTWVLPWVVDVADKTVSSHGGMPFFMSVVLDSGRLQKEIFE
jgi:hypothetical protein